MKNSRTITWDDPLEIASGARGLSGIDFLRGLIAKDSGVPIGVTLGFRLVEVDDGVAVFEAETGPWAYNPIGSVHGGWYAAVLDAPLGCALHTTLPAGFGYTTLEIKVNVVRSVRPDTGVLRATGKLDAAFPFHVVDHRAPRPPAPPPGATAEYGEYVARTFGCAVCHGTDLAGGEALLLGGRHEPVVGHLRRREDPVLDAEGGLDLGLGLAERTHEAVADADRGVVELAGEHVQHLRAVEAEVGRMVPVRGADQLDQAITVRVEFHLVTIVDRPEAGGLTVGKPEVHGDQGGPIRANGVDQGSRADAGRPWLCVAAR